MFKYRRESKEGSLFYLEEWQDTEVLQGLHIMLIVETWKKRSRKYIVAAEINFYNVELKIFISLRVTVQFGFVQTNTSKPLFLFVVLPGLKFRKF